MGEEPAGPLVGHLKSQKAIVAGVLNVGVINMGGKPVAGGGTASRRKLPGRNEKFVGRENELIEIHERLGKEGTVGVTQQVAAHGHGGVGKTAVGIEYGWRYLEEYHGGVYFVSCEAGDLRGAMVELAEAVGVEEGKTSDETARRVKDALENGKKGLLILDNVRDDAQWGDREWSQYLPGRACARLITTRARWLGGVEMYPIERLSREEGIELLKGYREDVEGNEGVVGDIVEWFDGLAVGLTVVGIYMARERGLAWGDYAGSLDRKGLGTVRETEKTVRVPDYEKRVEAVFDELLEKLSAAERTGVEYAVLLPEDCVMGVWVSALLEGDGVRLEERPGWEGRRGEGVVAGLVGDQLLRKVGEGVYSIHRVLRRRVREVLEEGKRKKKRERMWEGIEKVAEARGKASQGAVTEKGLRGELRPLLKLSEELRVEGRVRAGASLANWVHTPLGAMGWYEEGRASLERFVNEETLAAVGEEEAATTLSNFAMILKDLGDLPGARRRMERAIEIWEKHFEADHPKLAISYSNLATILKDLGDLPGARRRMERAIEIDEKHFEADHPTLAVSYSNLAMILKDLGDLAGARERMERAIEIEEKHFGADHPTLAGSYSNLAMILKDLGDLAGARQRMERAIEIDQKHFEADHPNLATMYSNLATILQDLGDLPGARQRMERAIEIDQKHFEADHPNLAISYNNLAHIELAVGRRREAGELFRRALTILRKRLPEGHPRVKIAEEWVRKYGREGPI